MIQGWEPQHLIPPAVPLSLCQMQCYNILTTNGTPIKEARNGTLQTNSMRKRDINPLFPSCA